MRAAAADAGFGSTAPIDELRFTSLENSGAIAWWWNRPSCFGISI